jgi:tripartite ATP-independent transporter DctP family solute receptor
MKRVLLSLAVAAFITAPAGAAMAQSKIVAVSDTGPTSIKGQTWKLFEKLVREKSSGKANVEISFGGALYAQKNLVQALQLGAVQFISPVVGVYSGTFPKLTVLVLPYLLPSPEAIRATMSDPEVGGALLGDMRKKGIEPLAIWLNGPRDIGTTAQKPIILPADVKGVTIRVPPGRNYVDTFKLLGANVTTMNWGEVPTALRQGVIDAVEPVPNAWVSSHLYESAKQITRTGYIWDFYIVAANKAWWDKLDQKTRDVLKSALDEATAWNWKNTNKENAKAYEIMKAAGATIHELTPEQKSAWVKAVQPLWKSIGNDLVGEKTMARLVQIGREHP